MSQTDPYDGKPNVSPEEAGLQKAGSNSESFCGNCLWWKPPSILDTEGTCSVVVGFLKFDDFCSYHQRRFGPGDIQTIPEYSIKGISDEAPTEDVLSMQNRNELAEEAQQMPYDIVEGSSECPEDRPVAVVKQGTGEVMGCHEDVESAQAQIGAIEAEERSSEESIEDQPHDVLAIVIEDDFAKDDEDEECAQEAELEDEILSENPDEMASSELTSSRQNRLDSIDEFLAKYGTEEFSTEIEVEVCVEISEESEEEGDEEMDPEEDPEESPEAEAPVDMPVEVPMTDETEEFAAVRSHDTPTSEGPWDGPANEARARSGESEDYYRRIYAWQDPDGDPATKAAWRFIHHEIDADGNPGAANLRACSTGIGVLNGGRGGTTIPVADRQGVYNHLAAHIRSADREVPELASISDEETFTVEKSATFGATPSHSTGTTDDTSWTGDEAKTRARSNESAAYYNRIYAWRDPSMSDTAKTSYKLIHHVVSPDGEPGAAVTWAVHACIAVINDSTIPRSDWQAVYNHLARHMRDAGQEVPELGESASIEEVEAAINAVKRDYQIQTKSKEFSVTEMTDSQIVAEMLRRWTESIVGNSTSFAPQGGGGPSGGEAIPEEETPEEEDMPDEEEDMPVEASSFDWEGVLIVEGLPSGDGRMIAEKALSWRELPLPLMLQTVNAPGHDGAVIAGSIHQIERVGQNIIGRGYFDSGSAGQELRRLLAEGTMRGVSADIDNVVVELRDSQGNDVNFEDVLFGDVEALEVLTEGRIMGATATPFPAFQEAYIKVLNSDEQLQDEVLVACGVEASGEVWRVTSPYELSVVGVDEPLDIRSLVASAGTTVEIPVNPPIEWFSLQEMDEPHPFTVYPDGRCYGLVAEWGTCHIGFRDRCVTVPKSSSEYRFFRNKNVLTAEGELVRTGPIYMDTVHPNLRLVASDAQAHYAHTGCAVADVALYENDFGIVAAGAVRPDVSPEEIRSLRGSDISPDWRSIDGNLEVVGLLAVNVSGFIVEGLAASGGEASEEVRVIPTKIVPRARINTAEDRVEALVAAGSIRRHSGCSDCAQNSSDTDVWATLAMMQAQIKEISAALRPIRIERATARLAEIVHKND